MDFVVQLTLEERIGVLQFIKNKTAVRIIEHNDGCRINLSSLPADILEGLLEFVQDTLSRRTEQAAL